MKKILFLLFLPTVCMATTLPIHWNRVNYLSPNHYEFIARLGYFYRPVYVETIDCHEVISRNAQLVQLGNIKRLDFMNGVSCNVKSLSY